MQGFNRPCIYSIIKKEGEKMHRCFDKIQKAVEKFLAENFDERQFAENLENAIKKRRLVRSSVGCGIPRRT